MLFFYGRIMSSSLQTYQRFCFASNILNNPGAYNMISILRCSLSIIVVERGVYVSRWSPPGAWSWCGGGSGGSHGRCSPTPPPCHRDTPRACTNHSSDTALLTISFVHNRDIAIFSALRNHNLLLSDVCQVTHTIIICPGTGCYLVTEHSTEEPSP